MDVHGYDDLDVRTLREPPKDVLRIVEVEDALARDESGQPVLDGKGKPIPMEDGCGLVSPDVAERIPRVANGSQTDEAGCDGGGPLVSQVVPGLAGKGHAAPLRYAPTAHDRGAPDASEGGRAARLRRGRLLGGGGLPDRGA